MSAIPLEIKKRIDKHINSTTMKSCVVDTSNFVNITNNNFQNKLDLIINLGLANNIKKINEFHGKVNQKLNTNGFYITSTELLKERRKRNKNKAPFGFKTIFLLIDFIYKRVLPKLPIIKQLYFSVTNGHNRVISKAESLGRLLSCGFKIIETFEYQNLFYVIAKKISEPAYDKSPTYGILCKLKRVGYNGKIFYLNFPYE